MLVQQQKTNPTCGSYLHQKLQSVRGLIEGVGKIAISFAIEHDHVGIHVVHTAVCVEATNSAKIHN